MDSSPGTRRLSEHIPGKVVVVTWAFVNGASEPQVTRSDGRVVAYTFDGGPPPFRGRPLAEWRRRFGGDEGELTDPALGQRHRISLKPWADADPDTTLLRFDFAFVPDQPIAPEHQHLIPPPPSRR